MHVSLQTLAKLKVAKAAVNGMKLVKRHERPTPVLLGFHLASRKPLPDRMETLVGHLYPPT